VLLHILVINCVVYSISEKPPEVIQAVFLCKIYREMPTLLVCYLLSDADDKASHANPFLARKSKDADTLLAQIKIHEKEATAKAERLHSEFNSVTQLVFC
jgi:hypothetical protein